MKKYSKLLAVTLCASIALASTGCGGTDKLKNAITNNKTASSDKANDSSDGNVKCLDYVTLGDYWGNSRVSEQFSDDRGVNVVFFNTEKVISQFYPILQDRAVFIETEIEDALQKHLIMPCAKTEKVAAFWNCYETTSYRNAAEKFAGNYRYLILRNGIKDFLRAHGALEHLRKGRRE